MIRVKLVTENFLFWQRNRIGRPASSKCLLNITRFLTRSILVNKTRTPVLKELSFSWGSDGKHLKEVTEDVGRWSLFCWNEQERRGEGRLGGQAGASAACSFQRGELGPAEACLRVALEQGWKRTNGEAVWTRKEAQRKNSLWKGGLGRPRTREPVLQPTRQSQKRGASAGGRQAVLRPRAFLLL